MLDMLVYGVTTLGGSFFCSLSEAALLSASDARIRARAEAGDARAARLWTIKKEPARTLAAIVFLNNIFAIAGTGALTAVAATYIDGSVGMGLFLMLWTFLVIAFGEITPKVLGEAQPEPIAGAVAPILIWMRRLMTPLIIVIELVVRWARPRARITAGEEQEIRQLARLGEEGGHIDAEQAELIHRVFRLDDITAGDVMTPRQLILGFRSDATVESIRGPILDTTHFQFPVYEEDLDTVVGILTLRDALAALALGQGERTVGSMARKPLFVPLSKRVDEALKEIQRAHGAMAVVIDEYGVTEGVITMDDLVEELVGEAIDDVDVSEGLVKRLSKRTALVHGLTRVRDVARFLNCPVTFEDPDLENTTVNGLLQEHFSRIPEAGDSALVPGGLRLTVREADASAAIRVLARSETPTITSGAIDLPGS